MMRKYWAAMLATVMMAAAMTWAYIFLYWIGYMPMCR